MKKEIVLKNSFKWVILICIPVFYVCMALRHFDGSLFAGMKLGIVAVLCIFAGVCIFLLFTKKEQLWKISFLTLLVLGTAYSLVIQLGSVPDETRHIQTAYSISDYLCGTVNSKHTVEMRADDLNYPLQVDKYSHEQYASYWATFNDGIHDKHIVDTGVLPLHTSPVSYWISGFGISIGRWLHLGTAATYMLARMLNLLFAAFCISTAIRITPIAKETFFVVSVFPMTLQQIMSFSYDMMAISLSFLITAFSLDLYFDKKTNREFIKNYVVLSCLTLLLCTLKSGAYIFTLLAPIFLLFVHCCREKKIATYMVLALTIIIAVAIFSSLVFIHAHPMIMPESTNYMEWAGEDGYSLAYTLHHPRIALKMMVNTYIYRGQYYFADTLIGTALGYLHVYTNVFIEFAFIVLIVSSLAKKEGEGAFPWKMRLVMGMIFLVTINAILFEFLIVYTPFSYNFIMGVQGRYFLPVLLWGLLSLYGIGFKRIEWTSPTICYIGILLNIISLWCVLA